MTHSNHHHARSVLQSAILDWTTIPPPAQQQLILFVDSLPREPHPMTTDTLVRTRAWLGQQIPTYAQLPPAVQNHVANFVVADRIRQRDKIMLELGHHPQAPDDNPVPGGSPI